MPVTANMKQMAGAATNLATPIPTIASAICSRFVMTASVVMEVF